MGPFSVPEDNVWEYFSACHPPRYSAGLHCVCREGLEVLIHKIAELRRKAELTQEEPAEKLGVGWRLRRAFRSS